MQKIKEKKMDNAIKYIQIMH